MFDFLNGQFGASHYTMVDCQVLKGSLFFWLLLYWLLFCNLLYRCAHVKDVRKLSYFEYLKVMKYICYLFVLLSAACYCVHVFLRYWFR